MAKTIKVRRGAENNIINANPKIIPSPGEIVHVYDIYNAEELVGFGSSIRPQFMVIGDGTTNILDLPRYWAWHPSKAIDIPTGARNFESETGLEDTNNPFSARSPYEAFKKIIKPYKAPSARLTLNGSSTLYRNLGDWNDSINIKITNFNLGSRNKLDKFKIIKAGQSLHEETSAGDIIAIRDYKDENVKSIDGSSVSLTIGANIVPINNINQSPYSFRTRTSSTGTYPTRWTTRYELYLDDGTGYKRVDIADIVWSLPIYGKNLSDSELSAIKNTNPSTIDLSTWQRFETNDLGSGGNVTLNVSAGGVGNSSYYCMLVPQSINKALSVTAVGQNQNSVLGIDNDGNFVNPISFDATNLYGTFSNSTGQSLTGLIPNLNDVPYTFINGTLLGVDSVSIKITYDLA